MLTPQRPLRSRPATNSGVGLIEILISLVVIAIGLLGLAMLQGKAQRAEMESYQRSQALILVQDMISRIRANRAGAKAGQYNNISVGYSSGFNDVTSCTDGSTQATVDLSCWHNALIGAGEQIISSGSPTNIGALMGGHGCINSTGADGYLVTVAWQSLNEISVSTGDPRATNTCGQGLYGGEGYRRILSLPLRFYDVCNRPPAECL